MMVVASKLFPISPFLHSHIEVCIKVILCKKINYKISGNYDLKSYNCYIKIKILKIIMTLSHNCLKYVIIFIFLIQYHHFDNVIILIYQSTIFFSNFVEMPDKLPCISLVI